NWIIDALVAVGEKALERFDVLLDGIARFEVRAAQIQPVTLLDFRERFTAEGDERVEIIAIAHFPLRGDCRRCEAKAVSIADWRGQDFRDNGNEQPVRGLLSGVMRFKILVKAIL